LYKEIAFQGVLTIAIDVSLSVLKGLLTIGDFMWGPDLVDNMVFCGGICCLHLIDNWFLYLYVCLGRPRIWGNQYISMRPRIWLKFMGAVFFSVVVCLN